MGRVRSVMLYPKRGREAIWYRHTADDVNSAITNGESVRNEAVTRMQGGYKHIKVMGNACLKMTSLPQHY